MFFIYINTLKYDAVTTAKLIYELNLDYLTNKRYKVYRSFWMFVY